MSPTASLESTIKINSQLHGPFLTMKNTFYLLYSNTKLEHLVAGVSGGVISTAILHPLDLIKVRLQVNEGPLNKVPFRPQYSGMFDTASDIVRKAGVRGLYQGVVPNLVGAGASWGLYFFAYNTLKVRRQNGEKHIALDAHVHMWLAAQAGVATLVLTNPIWVAKTRLCLQYEQTTSCKKQFVKADESHYRGMVDCMRKTYKAEGIPGLYRGFVPGVLGVSHGALQFMAYEELKKVYNSRRECAHDAKLGTFAYLAFAALSKIFAASVTYPYQVVRSRLQDQHRSYNGFLQVIKETYRHEGWRGFFKGMVPGVIKVTPACCITFVIYEHLVEYLSPSPK